MMAAPPMPGRRALNVVVLGMLLLGMAATPAAGEAPAGPGYHVSGNRIVDQSGTPFIVKGTDAVYGLFARGVGDAHRLAHLKNLPRDLAHPHGEIRIPNLALLSDILDMRGPLVDD